MYRRPRPQPPPTRAEQNVSSTLPRNIYSCYCYLYFYTRIFLFAGPRALCNFAFARLQSLRVYTYILCIYAVPPRIICSRIITSFRPDDGKNKQRVPARVPRSLRQRAPGGQKFFRARPLRRATPHTPPSATRATLGDQSPRSRTHAHIIII